MKGKGIALLLIGAAAWMHFGGTMPKIDGLNIPWFKPSTPAVVVAEPAADLKAIVAPVTAALKGHPSEAATVAALYGAYANVLTRAGDKIRSTADVRALVATSGPLLGAGLNAKVPGIGDVLNKSMADALGLENVNLDAAKRQRAIDACKAISWAAQQAG